MSKLECVFSNFFHQNDKRASEQCFLPFKPPFHPLRGLFMKNPFLVGSYIMIGTYISNFTFLSPVVWALR